MSLDFALVVEALPAYEVGEEIGRGAYGIVLAGHHRKLGREVAIKRLTREFADYPEVRARFVAEARMLASLDHPHIVPIYDYVEHEGLCLLVMERLTGGTVWSRFRGNGFTPQAACGVLLGTCAGLDYAHKKGVLHRDVKPENLMFSGDGVLKVADFGIAKVVGGSTSLATRSGLVIGTPAYIAPEQVEGTGVSPATDVYAAGLVLYELLSGSRPFPAVDEPMAALYQRVHHDPRPLGEADPAIPAPLVAVVDRALARAPEDRYSSAEDLGVAIADAARAVWGADWLGHSDVRPRRFAHSPAAQREAGETRVPAAPEPRKRGRWRVAAVAALVAAAAVIGAIALSSGGSGPGGGDAGPVRRAPPIVAPLGVKGNHLVSAAGRPVRLLGVNRDGSETQCTTGDGVFDGPTDQPSVTAMARWNINTVRIPLNEACWLGINGLPASGTAAAHRQAIDRYVELLARNGIYAILALQVASPGRVRTTANEQLQLPDADHGPAFWRSVARRFRRSPSVLFDLYGEPHDVTWECWRDGCRTGGLRLAGMQQLVGAIRSAGARQPILIGGLSYAGDVRGWLGYRPKDPVRRLVASLTTFEYSPCDAACEGVLAGLARRVPIVTTKLGQTDCAHDYIDAYMRFADSQGISYIGWTWNSGGDWKCKGGMALIKDYAGTPSALGVGLRDHLVGLGTQR